MILVRNVFNLKFGKAKEAMGLIAEYRKISRGPNAGEERFMTDITGPFYTFVMEFTAPSLSDYESSAKDVLGSKEFNAWYQKFIPLVESGSREIYTVIE